VKELKNALEVSSGVSGLIAVDSEKSKHQREHTKKVLKKYNFVLKVDLNGVIEGAG